MQEVEVTFGRAAQIWWAWLWRSMLFTILFSFLSGFVIGMLGHLIGLDPKQMIPVNMLLGAVIGVIVSIWIMTKILKKNFGSFRIALVKTEPA